MSAQSLIKDFFRSQSGKTIKKDSLKSESINDTIPYINPNGDSTNNNKAQSTFVPDSAFQAKIMQSIFILRQDYSLYNKKQKKYYGYDGLDYFGKSYSMGFKCSNANYVTDEAINPWEYDKKYSSYQSKNLIPVINHSRYRFVNPYTNCLEEELDTLLINSVPVKENLLYITPAFQSNQDGFNIYTEDTCTVGVLVWLVKENDQEFESGKMKLGIRCSKVNTSIMGILNVTPPEKEDKIIGGLFFIESSNENNKYLLAGITAKRDNSWTLQFPFKQTKNEKKDSKDQYDKGKLTEIKMLK